MEERQPEIKAYDSYDLAERAVARLERLGYGAGEISVVTGDPDNPDKHFGGAGVGVGGIAGGLLGVILATAATGGTGLLVAGPLAALLAGTTGGLLGGVSGGLMELGLRADTLDEKLHQGGMIVAVLPRREDDRTRIRAALEES